MHEAPQPVSGLRQEDLQVPAIPNSRRHLQKRLAHGLPNRLDRIYLSIYPAVQIPLPLVQSSP